MAEKSREERTGFGKTPRNAQGARSHVARTAALLAVALAVAVIAVVFFAPGSGGPSYTVKARFINAGQLVKGNLVEIAGVRAGIVKDFEITSDGQAEVEMEIDEKYQPLRRGVRAIIRQGSLSSVAGRYVDLHLPSEDGTGDEIPDGGTIPVDQTTTGVDLDEFFNIFDKQTRKSLRGFFRGQQRQFAGRGQEGNAGLPYLNPSVTGTTQFFQELSKDPPVLERFLVGSERFVSSLSERRRDLSALVENLNNTTRALGSEKEALAEVIRRFPAFMRTANTTYVNLRAALDDVDPLVKATKPVARKLRPYLAELRPFARDARPTVRDLSALVRRPGPDNDIIELNRTYPPLAEIAVDTRERNGKERRGAFPEATQALRDLAPLTAHGRPYTVDFLGWFDDFSHTGAYDALGSFSRSQSFINAFSTSQGVPVAVPLADRPAQFRALARIRQHKRCPGASEERAADGSNVFSEAEQKELDCRESDRATGAIQR